MRGRPYTARRLSGSLVAVAFGLVFLAPVLWMVAGSFKPDTAVHEDVDSLKSFIPVPFTTQNYGEAVRRGDVPTVVLNTLIMVALIAGGGILINGPAAYAFARMRFRGSGILFVVIIATIVVPMEVIVIPLFVTVQSTRDFAAVIGARPWTLLALSVPFVAKAFNIFLLRQAFLSLPRSLEEAAFLDGAGWWFTFWRVAVPNMKHAFVTVILLDFVIHWNDFLWSLVICQEEHTRTVQLGLGNFFTQPPIHWGAILAYAALATLPGIAAFWAGQRWIVESLARTGVRE